jgi:hypothetical protein
VIPRFVERVKVEDACNVPPFKVIDVALTEPGAAPRLRSAATDNVPAVIDTPPELVFVPVAPPVKVSVPAPDFVSEPVPDTTPDTVAVYDDATWIVAAADIATVPLTVPPAVKLRAPADDTPVPARLNGSAIEYAPISSVAPLDTDVLPLVSPSAEVLPIVNVPALTVVAPV